MGFPLNKDSNFSFATNMTLMRKYLHFNKIFIILIICTSFGCSNSDDVRYENPYLADINVNLQIDLDLPEYNNLKFPGNKYTTYNYGIYGVSVYCISPNSYVAFELTDPNHAPQNCSRLTVTGIEAACNCDDNVYNIITGQSTSEQMEFPLKPYRVEKSGNVLLISNF